MPLRVLWGKETDDGQTELVSGPVWLQISVINQYNNFKFAEVNKKVVNKLINRKWLLKLSGWFSVFLNSKWNLDLGIYSTCDTFTAVTISKMYELVYVLCNMIPKLK